MRVLRNLLGIVLIITAVYASSDSYLFHHDVPQGVIKGEEVNIEVMLSASTSDIYDVRLFFRELGNTRFNMKEMARDGYLYSTYLSTDNITTGQIEYYIAYEGALGKIGTLPAEMAEMNPYVMQVAPSQSPVQTNQVEILVLSPEEGEVIRNDELIIAASFLGLADDFDFSRTRLLIDGTNVTSLAEFSEGILTFSPQQIKSGFHNVEINVYDDQNNLIEKQEWSFRAIGGIDLDATTSFRGSAFIENRYRNISERDDNYFRTGAQISGSYESLDYSSRLVISSEENNNRQPVNRYAGQLRYNFSDRNNIYLKGGDFTPYYNPLAFQNKRVRGVQSGFELGFFTFDFLYGQLRRGIEGTIGDANGIYQEDVLSFRPGFRIGNNVSWNLNLINAKEDQNSIKYGPGVKESVVLGTDLNLNFDNRRILVDASVQASINNNDAGGPEITYDDLISLDSSLADNSGAESAWNFLKSTNLISLTPGLNPLPSLAMNFETTLRYFNNNLKIRYFKIAPDFASPGNPYLLKDQSGINVVDNFRLFNNQVFVNLFYRGYENNQSQDDLATSNNEIGGTISYFPQTNIPSLTFGFTNIDRSNNVSLLDTANYSAPGLYLEDNTTQSLTVSSTYNLNIQEIRNAITLSITNYGRDESVEIKKTNQSDFTIFGIGLRSRFNFPLTSRFNYSRSESVFGVSTSSESTTEIQRLFFGFDYRITNLLGTDSFMPFLNLTLQNIATNGFENTRNNYTVGLSYRNPVYGTFSLRYDQITYSALNFNDSIVNAKYQYNF